jgi:hypothetical protein
MNISDFLKSVDAVLQGDRSHALLDQLRAVAEQMADMTGWAPGVIDPHGRIDGELLRLQERAKVLYVENHDQAIAALHDALGELRQAIAEHDSHFEAPADDDDQIFD